jgi:hypothetical protein
VSETDRRAGTQTHLWAGPSRAAQWKSTVTHPRARPALDRVDLFVDAAVSERIVLDPAGCGRAPASSGASAYCETTAIGVRGGSCAHEFEITIGVHMPEHAHRRRKHRKRDRLAKRASPSPRLTRRHRRAAQTTRNATPRRLH